MAIAFIKERQSRWKRLQELIQKAEQKRITTFSTAELLEVSKLYRQATTDLAMAQTQQLDAELIYFLNDLVSKSYNLIYPTQKISGKQVRQLLLQEFPALVRQNGWLIMLSLLLLCGGFLAGFFGYLLAPETITGILPKDIVTQIIERYENNAWFNEPLQKRPMVSFWIMQNNILVALNSFAGGMLLGTLTIWALAFNGMLIGAIAAVFWQKGYLLSFWAMILPHGVIELTAIVLAAAGGFILAKSILLPGEYSRSDALKMNGGVAIRFLCGTVFLLVIAALIEGFLSTISTETIPEIYRLLFSGLTGVLLLGYFRLK